MPDDTAAAESTSAEATDAGREDATSAEDVSGLKATVKAERDARKAAERTLKDVQARLGELEGKDKTDVDRLTSERDRYKADLESRETRLREMAVRTSLTNEATKAGARYPDLLVDRLARDAQLDDDLAVTNAEKLVRDAKSAYPDLFRVVDGKADGGKRDAGTDHSVRGFDRIVRAHENAGRATR